MGVAVEVRNPLAILPSERKGRVKHRNAGHAATSDLRGGRLLPIGLMVRIGDGPHVPGQEHLCGLNRLPLGEPEPDFRPVLVGLDVLGGDGQPAVEEVEDLARRAAGPSFLGNGGMSVSPGPVERRPVVPAAQESAFEPEVVADDAARHRAPPESWPWPPAGRPAEPHLQRPNRSMTGRC